MAEQPIAPSLEDEVRYPPGQAEGNPGVQGWVWHPHQEKNPGTAPEGAPKLPERPADAFQKELSDGAAVRAAKLEKAKAAAGDAWVDPGPERLRLHVDISAHSVVDAAKLAAVAAAADGLVQALWEAGVRPNKAAFGGSLL